MKTQQQLEQEAILSDANPLNRLFPTTAKRNRLAADVENGPTETPGIGRETWDEIAGRYQRRGADLQGRTGPVLDETQANQSREMQMGALGLLQAQAGGWAPSSAAILANRANENAVRAAGQQVTSAKSLGGALATLRHAGEGAGQAMLAGNAANADARAAEISRGQAGYLAGAGAVRAGDIGAATQNAQLAAQQRALNEAGQQSYEAMQRNARYAQQHAGQLAQDTQNQQVADIAAIDAQKQAAERDAVAGFVGTAASVGSGAITAGMRKKGAK